MQHTTLRLAAVLVIAMVAFFVPYAIVSAQEEDSDAVVAIPASDCPDANRVFEQEWLAPPDTYSSECPDPDQLRADLESGQQDITKFNAMLEALKAGEIKQEQNPCTYPPQLKDTIGLSAAECIGELGQTLERQYK